MLRDPRVQKMAEVLVQYSLGVQPGQQVCIVSSPAAGPLIAAVYGEVLKAGGLPAVHLSLPELNGILLAEGSDEQLDYVTPFNRSLWDEFDAIVSIRAEDNTRANMEVPAARVAIQGKAARRYSKSFAWMQEGRPYASTQFPTAAYAQDAGMSLSDYEDFVFHACKLDQPDPISAWREVHEAQQRLVDWLRGKKQVHVESPNIDLSLSIEGRVFINSDGHNNFPSGEIYTGPVEDSVSGRIGFTYPALYAGHEVEDVSLTFERGRVTSFEAGRGSDFLAAMLDTDAGARRLGEFAIGTNTDITRFTRNVLFDEKIAGTMHCALGQTYPATGGQNTSSIHWDMVADMHEGRITVDGTPFYEAGRFLI
ncbi:MAG: aminopeptidase [Chloroflexia bacterium]